MPKISATTIRVVTLDSVLPVVSTMPGTSAAATNRDAAVTSTRMISLMRTSCHDRPCNSTERH